MYFYFYLADTVPKNKSLQLCKYYFTLRYSYGCCSSLYYQSRHTITQLKVIIRQYSVNKNYNQLRLHRVSKKPPIYFE